jgi:hypothetical protein
LSDSAASTRNQNDLVPNQHQRCTLARRAVCRALGAMFRQCTGVQAPRLCVRRLLTGLLASRQS